MSALPAPLPLPARLRPAVWRGDEVGAVAGAVRRSGWAALDAELPGGGWPIGELIEVLCPRLGALEWRLLAPALRPLPDEAGAAAAPLALIGPPLPPFLPGLLAYGLRAEPLLWIRAETLGERLWAAEQLLQSESAGSVLLWLPQSPRPQALRRLHARAGRHLLLVLRPAAAAAEASPAPLRVEARLGPGGTLQVQVRKRRGPPHEGVLTLPALPTALQRACAPLGFLLAGERSPVSPISPSAIGWDEAGDRISPAGQRAPRPLPRAAAAHRPQMPPCPATPPALSPAFPPPPRPAPHPAASRRMTTAAAPARDAPAAAPAFVDDGHVVARLVPRDDRTRRCG